MTLEMRTTCERCDDDLRDDGMVFICSYECTYCDTCCDALEATCQNCGGELVRRPRRYPLDADED